MSAQRRRRGLLLQTGLDMADGREAGASARARSDLPVLALFLVPAILGAVLAWRWWLPVAISAPVYLMYQLLRWARRNERIAGPAEMRPIGAERAEKLPAEARIGLGIIGASGPLIVGHLVRGRYLTLGFCCFVYMMVLLERAVGGWLKLRRQRSG